MSPNAALLKILGKADLDGKQVTIRHFAGAFQLWSADGLQLADSDHPAALSKYAIANGAISVRHEYDLKLAE